MIVAGQNPNDPSGIGKPALAAACREEIRAVASSRALSDSSCQFLVKARDVQKALCVPDSELELADSTFTSGHLACDFLR